MQHKLYRSKDHRVIAGVCGGLGEYFDLDPVIVRALFVVAALGGGFGFLAYIVLWVVIPEVPAEVVSKEAPRQKSAEVGEGKEKNLGAVVLILLGFLFLFNNYLPHWNMHRLWPLILVALGIALLARPDKK